MLDFRARVAQFLPQASSGALSCFETCAGLASTDLQSNAPYAFPKPYGFNIVSILTADFGISLIRIDPGQSTSLHFHSLRYEAFFVRSGRLTLAKGPEKILILAGSISGSKPHEPHRLSNVAGEPLEIIELFAPPLLDDTTRVEDRYNRVLGCVRRGQ